MSPKTAKECSEILAELFENKLLVKIPPQELHDFINENWRKLSAYAHRIHKDYE